jgi:uncharacterized protein (DUF2336 family)
MTASYVLCDKILEAIDTPSWIARAKAGERLARLYCAGELDPRQRKAAEEALRVLCQDGEVLVRQVVVDTLGTARALPRDIAAAIAAAN